MQSENRAKCHAAHSLFHGRRHVSMRCASVFSALQWPPPNHYISEAGVSQIGFCGVIFKKCFLLNFLSAITFCSERVRRSTHTGFLFTSQELSPLMIRKIIRLAAKNISEVV